MPDGLTFTINPDAQTTSVELFVKALRDISRLLNDVDYAIHRGSSSRRWVIEQLHSSAPTVTVQPLLGDQETVFIIAEGIRSVTNGTNEPPQYFTEEVLKDLQRMRHLFVGKDQARSIVVSTNNQETATIGRDISAQTNRILTAGYWNLASLEGILEVISVHKSNTFTIWDRISRSPVRCSVPIHSAMVDEAKELLGKRVFVRGSVRYFSNGVPRAITDVMDIVDATPDPNLPEASFGSIPDIEASQDPVKFLRKIRGVED